MKSKQSGMSLVEVMLASTLGLFLMFGFIQVYLTVQKTFHLQQAIVNIQENGRFAAHFLNESIRMAGYARCGAVDDFINTDLALHGYNTHLPDFLKDKLVKEGADSIVVGECILQNKKEKFEQFAFFIGPTDRKNKLGRTVYALYEKPIIGNKRELVSGIEDMQIKYGISNEPGGKNISDYLTADKVQDWKKIRAVEIALLLSSELPVLTQPEAYEFAGKKLPADRFLHREWHMYVALRELG